MGIEPTPGRGRGSICQSAVSSAARACMESERVNPTTHKHLQLLRARVEPGPASILGRRMWLRMLSACVWGTADRETFTGNTTLGEQLGAAPREIRRARALLDSTDLVTKRMKCRRGKRLQHRTLVTGSTTPTPAFRFPALDVTQHLTGRLRTASQATTPDLGGTLLVLDAILVCASLSIGGRVPGKFDQPVEVSETVADLMTLTGFTRRGVGQALARLEQAGIIERAGEGWRHGLIVHAYDRTGAAKRADSIAQRLVPKPAKLPTLPAPASLRRVTHAPEVRQFTRAGPERKSLPAPARLGGRPGERLLEIDSGFAQAYIELASLGEKRNPTRVGRQYTRPRMASCEPW